MSLVSIAIGIRLELQINPWPDSGPANVASWMLNWLIVSGSNFQM
jgi:hypothetical protein